MSQYAIIANTGIFIIGVIVQCTATAGGASSILGGRFVTGMGVGSLSMVGSFIQAQTTISDAGLDHSHLRGGSGSARRYEIQRSS